jgi:hypothetical protein
VQLAKAASANSVPIGNHTLNSQELPMPVNMQNLQNLASITSLDQLKLGADNQLQQRSGIGTFFLKIGDAFRNLSQAGRATIAQRNDSILNAMRAAVDQAHAGARAEDLPMAKRLSSVFQRLQTASANTSNEALRSLQNAITRLQTQASAVKYGLAGDPRFTALPSQSQRLLCSALDTLSGNNGPAPEAAMQRIKNDFFGIRPEGYSIEEGLRQFGDLLKSDFLIPSQQQKITDGIHESFIMDTRRRNVSSFNGRAVPTVDDPNLPGANLDKKKDNIASHCVRELRAILGEEHKVLLPFISMMASQAGLDSARSFLPFMSGLTEPADAHFLEADIMPDDASTSHDCIISREGDTLTLSITFKAGYLPKDSEADSAPGIYCKGSMTMVVNLASRQSQMVDGKEVFIPQFTLKNGDVRFETPAA